VLAGCAPPLFFVFGVAVRLVRIGARIDRMIIQLIGQESNRLQ